MKKLLKGFVPLALIILTFGCLNPEIDNSDQCIEGKIPFRFYRLRFPDCFQKSIWIEVSESYKIGKNVKISIHNNTALSPRPDVEYKNVVEAIIQDYPIDETMLESLEYSPIFFNYRFASEAEIAGIRSGDPNCLEVYENRGIPVIVITHFSFNACPKHSENF